MKTVQPSPWLGAIPEYVAGKSKEEIVQEYGIANLGGHLIPLNDLPRRVHELDSSREIVVYCHSGVRSGQAVQFLKTLGFRKVKNLTGGIDAWAEEIDPAMARY